jgi:hypothetical protein
MSNLPKPFWAKADESKKPTVAPLEFCEKKFGDYLVEYGKNRNNYVIHFFREGRFAASFRSKIFSGLTQKFRFNGNPTEQIKIDWVPEFDSWCAVIKDFMQMAPPPSDEAIEEALKLICS